MFLSYYIKYLCLCILFKGDLTLLTDGLVMHGNKIVIFSRLRERVVCIAHEGLQGIVKTCVTTVVYPCANGSQLLP